MTIRTTKATLLSIPLVIAFVVPSAASAQADASGDLHAIVFASKATRPEAETRLRHWEFFDILLLRELLHPAKSFPQVVSGEEVSGLGPGFHVVLGYCTSAELDARLKVLQTFYHDVKAPELGAGPASACPKLLNGARPVAVRKITASGKWISVATVVVDPDPDEAQGTPPATPDPSRGRVRVYAALFSEKVGYLEHKQISDCVNMVDLEHGPSCKVVLDGGKSQIVVKTDFHMNEMVTCAGYPQIQVTETTVGFGSKDNLRLHDRILKQVGDDLSCGH